MSSSAPESQPEAGGSVRSLGLDPSLTSFGVARVTARDGGIEAIETESWSPNLAGPQRLEWFWKKIERTLLEFRPHVICLEGYSYGSRGAATVSMGELGGVVRLCLYSMGAQPYVVAPAILKKWITGRGNAPKDIVRLEAWRRFEVEANTQDEVEAIGLAMLGLAAVEAVSFPLPIENRAALKALTKPGF